MSSAVGFGDAHIGAFSGHEFVSQEVVLQPPDEDGGHVIDVARPPPQTLSFSKTAMILSLASA